ncbi:MAG: type IA DNA topoisomerase, partial [Clostridia bacterium]|nr:type IA DNA topoisomerase [Clostridia bacterium]
LTAFIQKEQFFASFKTLIDEGYLKVAVLSFSKKAKEAQDSKESDEDDEDAVQKCDAAFIQELLKLKKNDKLSIKDMYIKEGETSPPKRYSSGSMILAMENAGQLIEDDELRAQIKGSGIGTSATRAEILKKLVTNQYLSLNKKTQIITPTLMGEMIYDVVDASIKPLLNPELTASWEKGLTGVAEGSISPEEYMAKLNGYVARRTDAVRNLQNQSELRTKFKEVSGCYKTGKERTKA